MTINQISQISHKSKVFKGDETFSSYKFSTKNDNPLQKLQRRLHSIVNKKDYEALVYFFNGLQKYDNSLFGIITPIDDCSIFQRALLKGWVRGFKFLMERYDGIDSQCGMYAYPIYCLAMQQKDESSCLTCLETLFNKKFYCGKTDWNYCYEASKLFGFKRVLELLDENQPCDENSYDYAIVEGELTDELTDEDVMLDSE